MVSVVLDTCVVSELRRPQCHKAVTGWWRRQNPSRLYLSVFTIAELRRGIEKLDETGQKQRLHDWSVELADEFRHRILEFDVESAMVWGRLCGAAARRKVVLPVVDSMIAAIAIRNGMEVATRNADHFVASGARVVDPWQG